MSALKTGAIIAFTYGKHKRDKSPLVLVLYGGPPLVHGLNLHYLSRHLNDQVISFIIKIISKQLSARDMKALYHDYMKKKLHPVIRRAYRTYAPHEVSRAVVVSAGFHETTSFLQRLKPTLSKTDIRDIKKKIKSQIAAEKEIIQKAAVPQNFTPKELEEAIQNYVTQMSKSSTKLRQKKGLLSGFFTKYR